MGTRDRRDETLAHVDLYGLTTAAAVGHAVWGGDRRQGRVALEALVKDRVLHRHDAIYSRRPLPYRPRDRWRLLAILSYCCLGNHARPRIEHARLAEAFGASLQSRGLPPLADKPCILDRHGRLARLMVEPYTDEPSGLDLGQVLAALQRTTRHRSFEFWSHAALTGEFALLVLCRSRGRADELARWLSRAPLVGRAGTQAVEIPTDTAVIQ